MSFYDNAALFIGKQEGFTPKASWDVNAWRLGYGSDTITLNNGTYRKVVQGDVTTQKNAAKDLARRIPEFEKKIIAYLNSKNGISSKEWFDLPDPARIGLLSFAYNYGNIVKNGIREAIKSGDVDLIADKVISTTINDNKGTVYYNGLRARRKREADLIRSEKKKGRNIIKFAVPVIFLGSFVYLFNQDVKKWLYQ